MRRILWLSKVMWVKKKKRDTFSGQFEIINCTVPTYMALNVFLRLRIYVLTVRIIFTLTKSHAVIISYKIPYQRFLKASSESIKEMKLSL